MSETKRILISGASGFVGNVVAKKLLEQDIEVSTIGRTDPKLQNSKHFFADLQDLNSVKNSGIVSEEFDSLIHLAWDGVSAKDKQNVFLQLKNLWATTNLFAASPKLFRRLITLGSLSEFDHSVRDLEKPLTGKEVSSKFNNRYAAMKYSSRILERELSEFSGVELIQTVVASIYGPGRDAGDILTAVIKNSFDNKETVVGSGQNVYDYIYVDDLANALIALENHGVPGETYALPGKDPGRTLESYLREAARILDSEQLLSFEYKPQRDVVLDGSNLLRDTGFVSSTDFSVGVKRNIEWLKA